MLPVMSASGAVHKVVCQSTRHVQRPVQLGAVTSAAGMGTTTPGAGKGPSKVAALLPTLFSTVLVPVSTCCVMSPMVTNGSLLRARMASSSLLLVYTSFQSPSSSGSICGWVPRQGGEGRGGRLHGASR